MWGAMGFFGILFVIALHLSSAVFVNAGDEKKIEQLYACKAACERLRQQCSGDPGCRKRVQSCHLACSKKF